MSEKHYRIELYGGRLDGTVMQLPYTVLGDVWSLQSFPDEHLNRDWYQLSGLERWDSWDANTPMPTELWAYLTAAKLASRRGLKLHYVYAGTQAAGVSMTSIRELRNKGQGS